MLAVLIAARFFGHGFAVLFVASFFVVLGHNFSVWLKFKGGRGLATGAGVFLVLQPWVVASWLAIWFLIYMVTRKVAYANAFATLLTPGVLLIRAFHLYDPSIFIIVFAIGVLIFIKHIPRLIYTMRDEEKVSQFQ
jgi:glycerol-3-phosphate acyltransferase PlsY